MKFDELSGRKILMRISLVVVAGASDGGQAVRDLRVRVLSARHRHPGLQGGFVTFTARLQGVVLERMACFVFVLSRHSLLLAVQRC